MVNSPKWRSGNLLLVLVAVLITTLIAEVALRLVGFQPGFKGYSKFKRVDSLHIEEGYYTDSNGIMGISQQARGFISNELKTEKSLAEIKQPSYPYSESVYRLTADFAELRDEKYSSIFKSFLKRIKPSSGQVELDEAIYYYANCPINTNGFRSIELKRYDSKKKSILLLGDSFTWGHSARNISNCFAELLLAKGYVVYNTGIIGADPAQYLQIARVYIPLLRPDYVVVNFCMGNDIYYFERKPLPNMPVLYSTNEGYIFSHRDGIYFSNAKEAYDFALCSSTIPADKGLFNSLCSAAVITSLFWNTLVNSHLMNLNYSQGDKRI